MPLGGAAVRHRVDQRQRRLAFGEVVADVLAELLDLGVVVERVVDELERLAEMSAVRRKCLLDIVALLREDRADPRAGFEQLRRLAVDDFHIVGLANVGVVAVHELQHFALGDRVGRVGEHVQDAQLLELDHHLEGARVEEIADEHARLIAEDRVRGLLTAAQAGAVDDVVVQQRRRMNELDDGGGRHVILAATGAAGARREQHGQGSQPLAAVVDDVVRDLVHERNVAAQAPHDHAVHVGPIVPDQGPQGLEGGSSRIRIRQCHMQILPEPHPP